MVRRTSAILHNPILINAARRYSDRIQPWVHYVPVKYDFTDLYDILAFFNGDVHGQGSPGHDDIGAAIGTAGRRWSLTHWRREDMVAYMFRWASRFFLSRLRGLLGIPRMPLASWGDSAVAGPSLRTTLTTFSIF